MSRIHNFSAGPAALPEAVLRQAQEELLDWHGAGWGVMEMSHRGKEFTSVIEQAEADLRALLGIPEQYRVLFLQGGATQQFAHHAGGGGTLDPARLAGDEGCGIAVDEAVAEGERLRRRVLFINEVHRCVQRGATAGRLDLNEGLQHPVRG